MAFVVVIVVVVFFLANTQKGFYGQTWFPFYSIINNLFFFFVL